MKLINKKYLKGFTIGEEYEFTSSEEIHGCHETINDNDEEWVMSKYKMLEFFTFRNFYEEKQNDY